MTPKTFQSPLHVDGKAALSAIYGPWDSVQAAKDFITGEDGLWTELQTGMTIGVIEDGKIVEYWNPEDSGEFVKKDSADNLFVEFSDVVEDAEISMQSTTDNSTSDGCSVVYCERTKTFLLKKTQPGVLRPTYYGNWIDGDTFGTGSINGRVPYRNRIYVKGIDNYRANESGLALVSSDIVYKPGEDLALKDQVLVFADKPYSNTEIGKKYLRTGSPLTGQLAGKTRHIVRDSYDLGGERLNLPVNATLVYDGGKISNCDLRGNSSFFLNGAYAVDFDVIGDNVTPRVALRNIPTQEITLSLMALPGYLAKYNLKGDGVTDDSINFNALLNDFAFVQILKEFKVTLLLGAGYYRTHPDSNENFTFLFKDTITIGAPATDRNLDLHLVIAGDVKFDWSGCAAPRSLEAIRTDTAKPRDYNCFVLAGGNFHISVLRHRFRPTSPANIRSYKIDGGRDTLLGIGNYYEGVVKNNNSVQYSSFSNNLLTVSDGAIAEIIGGDWCNAYHGISLKTRTSVVDSVHIRDIYGDNGITIADSLDFNNGSASSNYRNQGCVVRNCHVEYCEDLGISIQCKNAIVENCTINNCGNNNIEDGTVYGVNHSYNNGGGISIETNLTYSDVFTNGIEGNILINNCIIEDCYNYALCLIGMNATVDNCTIRNIINTWKTEYSTLDGKTTANGIRRSCGIRKGGIIQSSISSEMAGDNKISINVRNSFIDCGGNLIVGDSAYDCTYYQLSNCEIVNMPTIPDGKRVDNFRKAVAVNCLFDNYNFDLIPSMEYYNASIQGKSVGLYGNKPATAPVGYRYLCTDKQTAEGAANGMIIYHKGNGVWIDALGRTVN